MKLKQTFIQANFEGQSSNRAKTDSKIMLILHGLGDHSGSYIDFVKELNITGCHYLLLNAPEAYFTGYAWFLPDSQDIEKAMLTPTELVLRTIEDLIKEGFQHQDIILCGFSQGGAMVLNTALKLTRSLGGIITLSPKTYPFMEKDLSESFKKTPLFMSHGTYDSVIPFEDVEKTSKHYASELSNFSFYEYNMDHEIDPMEMIDLRSWVNEIL